VSNIGVGIPREQALRIARRILEDAERERSQLVEREAQLGITIDALRAILEGETKEVDRVE
jgi:hypothetical protein